MSRNRDDDKRRRHSSDDDDYDEKRRRTFDKYSSRSRNDRNSGDKRRSVESRRNRDRDERRRSRDRDDRRRSHDRDDRLRNHDRDDDRSRRRSRDRDERQDSRERSRDSRRDDRNKNEDDDRRFKKNVKPWTEKLVAADDEAKIPWGGIPKAPENPEEPIEKEQPSLKPSGKLLEDTNMVNGVVVKYVEPPEAKLPKANWQLHPFRNIEGQDPEPLPVMHIHRRSCFLIGRDRKVCQFPMDHPSCSKQHAALQFRSLPYTKPDGERSRRTKPYLIDLESANGTFINDDKLDSGRYYELKHGDDIKFGFSSRSFVILNATAAINQTEMKQEIDSDDEEEDEKPHVVKKEDDKFAI